MNEPFKSTVLIVDDEPLTCDMLAGFLLPDKYNTILARSGQEALDQVKQLPPDVILLDIMMPELDGFEVCQQLKSDKRWRHIPIILVTALNSQEDLVRGLDAGADDFISKPVDRPELRARVRSALRIKQQHDALEATLQMREDLTHMIVHDIRNPLTAIMGLTQLLLTRNTLTTVDTKDIQTIQSQTYRLDAFVNDMLILAKLESEQLIINRSMVDINQMAEQVRESYSIMAKSKNIDLMVDLPATTQHLFLDTNLFQRVLENLVSNAIKFSPHDSKISMQIEYLQANTAHATGPQVQIKITDNGPDITREDRDRIFNKFEAVKWRENTDPQIGLGLAFCKMVIEAHQGYLSVKSNPGGGSIFTIEI